MVDPQIIARGVDNMHVRRFSVVHGPDPQFSQDLFPYYRRSFVDQRDLFVYPQFVSGGIKEQDHRRLWISGIDRKPE